MKECWLIPDWNAPPNVSSLVTTRAGGVSEGAFAGLNLGTHVGDDPAAVGENRARLRAVLPSEPLWLEQVHGVEAVTAEHAGSTPRADAAVARTPGTVCAVMTADCLPVLFCDRAGTVVAAAHAGWRGLADGVLESVLAKMGVSPASVVAWLGPAIGPEAFEVGEEVRQRFVELDPNAQAAFTRGACAGKWMADLFVLARLRLERAGVGSISGGGICTFAERERFYSYRRDGTTGRFASLIWLTDQ